MRPFQCFYSGKSLDLLHQLNISLMLSTYQAGKVIVLSSDGKQMYQLVRDFQRPMGIAVKDSRMALAGALGTTVFRTDPHLAKTYPEKPDTYDAFYYPTTQYRTDYVDIHDIAFTKQGLVGVNTSNRTDRRVYQRLELHRKLRVYRRQQTVQDPHIF